MANQRKELLRRFYLTLELMCNDAERARRGSQSRTRIGDLYDDADEGPSLWERGSTRPFLFAQPS